MNHSYPTFSSRPCLTCGQTHPHIPGTYSTDCILLGSRTHNSHYSRHRPSSPTATATATSSSPPAHPPPHLLTTIPIPSNIRSQALLFDQIWFWFIDMKHENDDLRHELAANHHVNKGMLRATAPLLWFEWRGWDGRRGQTRNQENFERAWRRFVWVDGEGDDGGKEVPVAWVTLRRMEVGDRSVGLESPVRNPGVLRRGIVT